MLSCSSCYLCLGARTLFLLFVLLSSKRGGVGILGFADFADVWFGFRFSHLKTAVFRFWGLPPGGGGGGT